MTDVIEPRAPAHVLTQYHLMSPSHLARAMNNKYGANTVTWFGILDPKLGEKQMNAAAGATVFKATPLGRGISDPQWAPDDLGNQLGL